MESKKKIIQNPSFLLLLTIDGWDENWKKHKLLKQAETHNFDELISSYPYTSLCIERSQEALKKIKDLSEVGYYKMGTGESFFTPLNFIDKSIKSKEFFKNKILLKSLENVKKNNSQLHLLGLASDSLIHSSLDHLDNLLMLAKKREVPSNKIFIHLILDGVDTEKNRGIEFIDKVKKIISKNKLGNIATIHGRTYAMDRNNNWSRTAKSYQALTQGEGRQTDDPEKIIQENYNKEIYDYELPPVVITKGKKPLTKVDKGDSFIFFNVSGDYARQLTKSFVMTGWEKFPDRTYVEDLFFVCFTEYEKHLPVKIAFPKKKPNNVLSEVLDNNQIPQLKISGHRKYPHLNLFFNGNRFLDTENQTTELIMSHKENEIKKEREITEEVGEKLIKNIKNKPYKFILANLANFDKTFLNQRNQDQLVGYIETTDNILGKIIKTVNNKNGLALITSTSNLMPLDKKDPPKTPLIMIKNDLEGKNLGWEKNSSKVMGDLSDIYSTVLKILEIPYNKNKGKPLI